MDHQHDLALQWSALARRSQEATRQGALAFERLLRLAEQRESSQTVRIVHFLAAVYDSDEFDWEPIELRAVDTAISDDMLACLDALRWGRADLHTLVPNGETRLLAALRHWGLHVHCWN